MNYDLIFKYVMRYFFKFDMKSVSLFMRKRYKMRSRFKMRLRFKMRSRYKMR